MSFFSSSATELRTDPSAQIVPGDPSGLTVYVLQPGETLAQVAAKFGVTPQALLAANPQLQQLVASRGGLFAGMQLGIPLGAAPPTQQAVPYAPPPGYVPRAPNGLQPPTGGVSMQAPYVPPAERSFFSDPNSGAPPPTAITWPRPLRGLRMGVIAPDVETLQRGLARVGYAVRVDGNFAAGTDAAVRSFQNMQGLSPTGVMDAPTWVALMRAADAVRTPSQILVTARREQFASEDERNAYDIMVALAYDNPGQAATGRANGYGLREILRLCGQPVDTRATITPQAVTAFAYKALGAGLPLNERALAPLRALQLRGYNKPTYHEAKALGDFFVNVFPGYAGVTNNHTYDALITSTARQYGVPPELVKAVMSAESSFKPWEVSYNSRGEPLAHGLMQLLPGTAAFVGVPDISTPQANVLAGVRYLAYLLRRFNGNLINTIAAYNAGPTRIENNGGVPPIQETMDYTRRVLVNYTYYLQHPPYAAAS